MTGNRFQILRPVSISLGLGLLYVADRNSAWQSKLSGEYREWYYSHEEYRRAVKLVSKTQSDRMKVAGRSVDSAFSDLSPFQIVKEVEKVRTSYTGIVECIAIDSMHEVAASIGSNLLAVDVKNEDGDSFARDLDKMSPAASIEEREDVLRQHAGLKSTYKTFVIAMASAKEAAAREKMLNTLTDPPHTLLRGNKYFFNEYMWWGGLCLSGAGGLTMLRGWREMALKFVELMLKK
jgi:hypothetical protein